MTTPTPLLVIIEDNDADYTALIRAMKQQKMQAHLQRCLTGDEALEYLHTHPHPHLIILDLNLPGTDGREVLKNLKQNELIKKIPVVILTTSNNPADIQYCYQWGANSYIQKPIDYNLLLKIVENIKKYWFEMALLPLS